MYKQSDLLSINEARELIKENSAYGVYVVNVAKIRTNAKQFEDIGINNPYSDKTVEAAVNLFVGEGNNVTHIMVPPIWIPIDLSTYADSEKLLESSAFKQALAKGFLTLITKEAYERVMSTEEAQEAKTYYASSINVSSSAGLDVQSMITEMNNNVKSSGTLKTLAKSKNTEKRLSSIVHTFVNIKEDDDHNGLFQQFKNVENKLTDDDLEHLRQNAGLVKIKAAATKALNKRRNINTSEESQDPIA